MKKGLITLTFIIFLLINPLAAKQNSTITIMAAGDINLVSKRPDYLLKFSLSPGYYFKHIKPLLKKGDINFCNFEQTATDDFSNPPKPWPGKAFTFLGTGDNITTVADAGFNLFNLANNHIMDYGKKGLIHTLKALKVRGIRHFGAGLNDSDARTPMVISVKGIRIAFLGYIMRFYPNFHSGENRAGSPYYMSYTTKGYYRGINKIGKNTKFYFEQDIKKAKKLADIVVVSIHFGDEYHIKVADYQKITAKKAIDAGADLVLGHHPHVIQKTQKYKNAFIFYSLGNLVFPSYFTDPYVMIAEIKIKKGKISNAYIHPFVVKNRHDFNLHLDDYVMFMPVKAKGRWLTGFEFMLKERGFKFKKKKALFECF
jgi:poly-gamma-glutamate synthesis protein (capsule biosynthesis protein)